MKFSEDERQKKDFAFNDEAPQQFKLKEMAEKDTEGFSRSVQIFLSSLLITLGLLYYGYCKSGMLPNPVLFVLTPLMLFAACAYAYLRSVNMKKRLGALTGQPLVISDKKILANGLIALGITAMCAAAFWLVAGPTNSGLQKVCRSFSDNATAQSLYNKHNYSDAIKAYTEAISSEPINPLLYEGRGFCYLGLSRNQEGLNDMGQAIQVSAISAEDSVHAFECRGNYYAAIGQHQKAIDDYTKALSLLPPKDGNLFRERARAYKNLGNNEQAQKDLDAAEKI